MIKQTVQNRGNGAAMLDQVVFMKLHCPLINESNQHLTYMSPLMLKHAAAYRWLEMI